MVRQRPVPRQRPGRAARERLVRAVPVPQMGDAWVHPRCVDASTLAKAAVCGHLDLATEVAERRRKRHLPLGVLNP
jgi:hypothetical protein